VADEIERYCRKIIERTGDHQQAERITDQALLCTLLRPPRLFSRSERSV
jgi:hypothetical protein